MFIYYNRGALTRAEWDPELKIANVTHRVGRHWKQMGHEVGGKLHLFPEEALFLLETVSIYKFTRLWVLCSSSNDCMMIGSSD
jgi:hypothetical protein